MMVRKNKLHNQTGGTLIEYALIAGIAVAALTVMTTYISRGMASVQNNIDFVGGNY